MHCIRARIAAVAVALAAPAAAHGQASPAPASGSPAESGTAFSASGGVDGNLALGVIDRYLIGARGVAQLTTPTWGFYVEPRWLRAEVNDNKTDSEYYLRAVGYLMPRNRFYGFALGMAERSFRRKYEHRFTGGGGTGANLLARKRATFLVALGALVETTDFSMANFEGRPELTSSRRNVFRVATRASGRFQLSEKGTLFFDVYFKPNVTDPGDYRILARTTLDVAVAQAKSVQLSARVFADYTRETVVVVGTARNELLLAFGLGARWQSRSP